MFRGDKYVTPLYKLHDDHTPEQGASGIWVSIGSECFLFTAAHAIDDGFIWFPMQEGFKRIESPGFYTSPPNGDRLQDKGDFAVFHLSRQDIEAKHPFHEFLPPEQMVVNIEHRAGDRYEFTGYPYRREHLDRRSRKSHPGYTSISSIAVPQDQFDALKLLPHTHIVISYERESMMRDGVQITGPLPHGISGGAVWKRYEGNEERKLAAIAIEFRSDCLIGTRLSAGLEFIRLAYPHLSPHIPVSSDVDITITRSAKNEGQ